MIGDAQILFVIISCRFVGFLLCLEEMAAAVCRAVPKLRCLRQALLAPCTSRRLFGSVHHKDDPTHFHLGFVICFTSATIVENPETRQWFL